MLILNQLNIGFKNLEMLTNYSLDLKDYGNALEVTQGVDYIFNFACNMGVWVLLKIIKQNVWYQF